MSKRKIISITGNIAGGKTEVVKLIAEKLNMNTYSGSESFRKLAREYGMCITEFNEYVKDKPEIDRKIDNIIAEHINEKDNIIIDARLAWHFAEQSFKVYINVDLEVAAKRLQEDSINRGQEEKYLSVNEAKSAIIQRQNYERDRYISEYGVDLLDYSNYDLVVDSSNLPLNEVAQIIIEKYLVWLKEV